MGLFKKYHPFIEIALAVFALAGILFPVANLSLHLIGTINISFSFTDLFQNLGGDAFLDTFGLATSDDLFSNVSISVILPLISYMLAILLTVGLLVLTIINKFETLKIIFLAMAILLMFYAGIGMNDFPNSLSGELEQIVAYFLDSFSGLLMPVLDHTDILEINLGAGYWITFCALFMLLIIWIVVKITAYTQKKAN